MNSRVQHASDNAGRGLSGFWTGCPIDDLKYDPSYGNIIITDFNSFGGTVTSNVGTYCADGVGGIKSFEDNSCTLVQTEASAEVPGGIIRATVANTDNHSVGFEFGYGNAGSFTIAAGYQTWFECRVRLGQITDQCFFVGLAEKGLAINDGLFADNATATGTKDLLGFTINSATPSIIRPTYGVNGTTTTLVTTTKTAVASTWYKLGVYCDGQYVHHYIDGVEYGTPFLTTATNVPDLILLTPLVLHKNGDGTQRTFDVDWMAVAQKYYRAN